MSRQQYVDFIEKNNLRLIQYNKRSWGSYQLTMGFDHEGLFNDGEVFGWGFSTHDAAIAIFEKYITERGVEPQFARFIGAQRLNQLISIVLHPEPEQDLTVVDTSPKLLLPKYDGHSV